MTPTVGREAVTLPYQVRIRCGASARPAADDGLSCVHRTTTFIVEAAGKTTRLDLGAGCIAIVAGTIDGIRDARGHLQPIEGLHALVIDRDDPARSTERLEGRFTLVVAGPGDRCWVGTDRFGRADVYVAGAGDDLAAATDLSLIKGIAASGYDQAGWAHALVAYGYRPPKQHTLYAGVRRLAVGESLLAEDGRVSAHFAAFEPTTSEPLSDRLMNAYADRLLDAVRVRGSQNGNVVFLSSGWDSTSLLACLVHVFGAKKVRTVIGRMRYAERSGVINQFEIDRARAVADYYGVPLEIAEFDYTKTAPAQFDQVRRLFREHHIASITGLNHFVLAQHVARTTGGDEAIFAGEISDGAHNLGFSQFVTIFHPVQAFREYADKMAGYLFGPTFLAGLQAGTHESDAVYAFLRGRIGPAELDAPAPAGAARTQQFLSSFFLRGTRFPLASLRNARVLREEGARHYAAAMERTYLAAAAQSITDRTLYAWYLRLYNSFHWQGSTVATLALTAEAQGLRAMLPFWDGALQDVLSGMPEDAGRGLDLHPTKYPLKWTLEHRLDYPFHLQVGPHSYLYDVDPSFSHSAELVYGSSFAPMFRDALATRSYRRVLDDRLFDLAYIDGAVDRYLGGTEARGGELNDLLSLALMAAVGWYEP